MSNKSLYIVIGLILVCICILGYKVFTSPKDMSPGQPSYGIETKEVVGNGIVVNTQPSYSLSEGKLIRTSPDSSTEVIADLVSAGVTITEGCGSSASDVLGGLSILGRPTISQKIFFVEGCAEGGGVWSFDLSTRTIKKLTTRFEFGSTGESPEGNFQVRMGPKDAYGEVRRLEIADFYNDKVWLTDSLPENYTYTKSISEFNGASLGQISWVSDSSVYAEIYLSDLPLSLFDYRTGIFMKNVELSQ